MRERKSNYDKTLEDKGAYFPSFFLGIFHPHSVVEDLATFLVWHKWV